MRWSPAWLGLGEPELASSTRIACGAPQRFKVIAGTFDYRLGWIDLDEATRRGITVVDTSRTMT